MPVSRPLLLIALAQLGCAGRRPPPTGAVGPRHATLPMWRPSPGGDRIFIEAELGDGEPRLFLVDTGAAVSVISTDVADALSLEVQARPGRIVGVGGASRLQAATIDQVHLGPFALTDVDVAVGVPGVPRYAGLVPLAGILGNNVWQQFLVVLDYPADAMELWRPEHAPEHPDAGPMHFNGDHVRVEAILEVDAGPTLAQPIRQAVWLEVDSGASGLLISGAIPGELHLAATEGEEPIFGIGGGDDLPASSFLRRTRRLTVDRVHIGEVTVDERVQARWINFDQAAMPVGPAGMPGLLGHHVMDDYRVVIDYQRRRFGLLASSAAPTQRDVHDWALGRLRRARTAEEARFRAELLAAKDDLTGATAELRRWNTAHPDDAGVAVLLARLLRYDRQPAEALALIDSIPVQSVLDQGELVAAVNAWWLAGDPVRGRALADAAVRAAPEHPRAWLALADALRFSGDPSGARQALAESNRLDENPDGQLVRRAWLAAIEGDRFGAITHARRLMELYPSGSLAPWFYAHQVDQDETRSLLGQDITRARGRLHPGSGPLDFFAGAMRASGDPDGARALAAMGRARDCTAAPTAPSRDNCEAWYRALAHDGLGDARAAIDRAVAAEPGRPDYLDTRAMVLEAQGEVAPARDAAWAAARTEPDNLYFLWQAARLDRAARGDGS